MRRPSISVSIGCVYFVSPLLLYPASFVVCCSRSSSREESFPISRSIWGTCREGCVKPRATQSFTRVESFPSRVSFPSAHHRQAERVHEPMNTFRHVPKRFAESVIGLVLVLLPFLPTLHFLASILATAAGTT